MVVSIFHTYGCRRTLGFSAFLLSQLLFAIEPTESLAGFLTQADFSASRILIDFNGLTPASSVALTDGDLITTQYAHLGATFSVPDPRPRFEAIPRPSTLVSTGNMAVVNRGGGDFSNVSPLEIALSVPANKFGTRFGISAESDITLQLYSSGGALLDSYTFLNPSSSFQIGFLGLSTTQNITLVKMSSTRISGVHTGRSLNFSLDDVQYESTIIVQPVDPDEDDDAPAFDAIPPGTGSVNVDLPATSGGSFSAVFDHASQNQVTTVGIPGAAAVDFLIPGTEFQYWSLEYSGTFDQTLGATVVFTYDPSLLSPDTDESQLAIYHFDNGAWVLQNGMVNVEENSITVSGISHFSNWGLGAVGASAVTPEPASLAIWSLGSVVFGVAGLRYKRRVIKAANQRSDQ